MGTKGEGGKVNFFLIISEFCRSLQGKKVMVWSKALGFGELSIFNFQLSTFNFLLSGNCPPGESVGLTGNIDSLTEVDANFIFTGVANLVENMLDAIYRAS
jgi:hypothetical protein